MGSFDGIVCGACGYGLLTEKRYEDTGRAIEAARDPAAAAHAP